MKNTESPIQKCMMEEMNRHENGRIETIARGVCVQDDRVLLCRPKGGARTYLPGGHIEFGESAAQALIREIREEMGVNDVSVCNFLGIVENAFSQADGPHMEINVVYQMKLPPGAPAVSKEDWIEFEWCPLAEISSRNVLPETTKAFMRRAEELDRFVPVALLDGDHAIF